MNKIDEKHFIGLIEEIVEQYELDYGHGRFDVSFNDGAGYLVVEAPLHSVVAVSLSSIISYVVEHELDSTPENDAFISRRIKLAVADCLEDFSANEELHEYRDEISVGPSGRGMPANSLRAVLTDCEDFFKETAYKLRQDS